MFLVKWVRTAAAEQYDTVSRGAARPLVPGGALFFDPPIEDLRELRPAGGDDALFATTVVIGIAAWLQKTTSRSDWSICSPAR